RDTAWPDAPASLVALIRRMVSRDKNDRPELFEVRSTLAACRGTLASSPPRRTAPTSSRTLEPDDAGSTTAAAPIASPPHLSAETPPAILSDTSPRRKSRTRAGMFAGALAV